MDPSFRTKRALLGFLRDRAVSACALLRAASTPHESAIKSYARIELEVRVGTKRGGRTPPIATFTLVPNDSSPRNANCARSPPPFDEVVCLVSLCLPCEHRHRHRATRSIASLSTRFLLLRGYDDLARPLLPAPPASRSRTADSGISAPGSAGLLEQARAHAQTV